MPMTTTTITVTPEMARRWLDAMPVQRAIRKTKVNRLVQQIKRGRWQMLPHGLVFDEQDKLIDGQHRLHAIVEAGVEVKMRATTGAAASLYNLIDADSAPKKVHDALHHVGAAKGASRIMQLPLQMMMSIQQGRSPFTPPEPAADHADYVALYNQHPYLGEAARMLVRLNRLAPSCAVILYFFYRAYMKDPVLAELFIDQLYTGANLKPTDPALQLRNWWVDCKMKGYTPKQNMQAEIFVRALNAVYTGKKVGRLVPTGRKPVAAAAHDPYALAWE